MPRPDAILPGTRSCCDVLDAVLPGARLSPRLRHVQGYKWVKQGQRMVWRAVGGIKDWRPIELHVGGETCSVPSAS